jgi:hypothetical protein
VDSGAAGTVGTVPLRIGIRHRDMNVRERVRQGPLHRIGKRPVGSRRRGTREEHRRERERPGLYRHAATAAAPCSRRGLERTDLTARSQRQDGAPLRFRILLRDVVPHSRKERRETGRVAGEIPRERIPGQEPVGVVRRRKVGHVIRGIVPMRHFVTPGFVSSA